MELKRFLLPDLICLLSPPCGTLASELSRAVDSCPIDNDNLHNSQLRRSVGNSRTKEEMGNSLQMGSKGGDLSLNHTETKLCGKEQPLIKQSSGRA